MTDIAKDLRARDATDDEREQLRRPIMVTCQTDEIFVAAPLTIAEAERIRGELGRAIIAARLRGQR